MALLVCTATAKEMAHLAPAIFPSQEDIPEMQVIYRNAGGREIIFLVTGISILNTAFAIGQTLEWARQNGPQKKVAGIIYTGLAGAFNLERTPLCAICRVTKEVWPEYGLHDGISVTAKAFKFPLWKMSDGKEVYDELELANSQELMLKKLPDDWLDCVSLTVAGVSASFARRDKLQNLYGADLENMEGFAAAYIAARENIPCLEIRVVSNKTGPRSRAEKDFEGALKTMGQILPALNLIWR